MGSELGGWEASPRVKIVLWTLAFLVMVQVGLCAILTYLLYTSAGGLHEGTVRISTFNEIQGNSTVKAVCEVWGSKGVTTTGPLTLGQHRITDCKGESTQEASK